MLDHRAAILRDMTLLYVEDDSGVKDAVSFSFTGVFKKVVLHETAEMALNQLVFTKPDMVITDICLPFMNGIEFARRVKEIIPDIPVVIISGHKDEKYLFEAIETKVDYYFTKPVNLKHLKMQLYKIAENLEEKRKLENSTRLINKVLDNSRELYLAGDLSGITYMNATLLDVLGFSDAVQAESMMDIEPAVKIVENSSRERQTTFRKWVNFVCNMDGYESMVSILRPGSLTSDAKSYIARVSRIKDEGSYIISFVDVTVIERQKQFFHNLAMKDPLTDIFNRHKFNETIRQETDRSRRYGAKFSIVMFDIDRFKAINDFHGHQVGDSVLKELASLVSVNIRVTDIFARYGGEEFIIIVPEVSAEGGMKLADKLRRIIEVHEFKYAGKMTCSFGVSEFRKDMTGDEVVKLADEALYRAKSEGRNRVEVDK